MIYKIYYFRDDSAPGEGNCRFADSSTDGVRLCITLSRLNFEIFREPPRMSPDSFSGSKVFKPDDYRRLITVFENIGAEGSMSYSGAFVSGRYPCWIMCAGSGGSGASGYTSEMRNYSEISTRVTKHDALPACGKNTLMVYSHLPSTRVSGFCATMISPDNMGFCFVDNKVTLEFYFSSS